MAMGCMGCGMAGLLRGLGRGIMLQILTLADQSRTVENDDQGPPCVHRGGQHRVDITQG